MESLDNQSNLPPGNHLWVKLVNKIADFVFLPYISFIIAFKTLECMKRFTPESNWGDKIADFGFLSYISFSIALQL